MNMTFFGTDTDIAQVWRWVLEFPGMKLFEDHSRPDQPNRWFDTWEQVQNSQDVQIWGLAAWSESIGGRPRIEQIVFNERTQQRLDAKGRTALHSPASIKIGRNNDQNGCLASGGIGCWTEKGARQRSIFPEEFINEVDWASLQSVLRKVQRQIAKSAPAKLRSYPIMSDAFALLSDGRIKLWNWGTECTIASPLITCR
jgi:hypothetical protein